MPVIIKNTSLTSNERLLEFNHRQDLLMGSETHAAHSRCAGFTEQLQEIQSRGVAESSQAHELHGCGGQDILAGFQLMALESLAELR